MTSKLSFAAFVAGALSAGLFLVIAGIGLGFFFLFLPSLPLFLVGMGKSPRLALYGSLLAAAIIGVIADISVALIFLFMLGLPAWYISRLSLLWRSGDANNRQWFPLGPVFCNLTLYACAILVGMVAYYAQEPGGLPHMISSHMQENFTELGPQYQDMVKQVATNLSFLLFSATLWLWQLLLFAHGWFAHRMLRQRGALIRPEFAISPFAMSNLLLILMVIAAAASLTAEPSLSFLGKSALVGLLFPYFLQGAAFMHNSCATWPNRRFFLFFIYLLIAAQLWPALILSGIGVWQHIKRLSSPKSSSSN